MTRFKKEVTLTSVLTSLEADQSSCRLVFTNPDLNWRDQVDARFQPESASKRALAILHESRVVPNYLCVPHNRSEGST